MTFVGHMLTGMTIGTVVIPSRWSRAVRGGAFATFALLAFVPDLKFPGWGHERYYFSHSVFVNTAFILPLATIAAVVAWRKKWFGWPVIVGAAAAWLSHLLLDTFYNHGKGLAMFWPGRGRLALPIPWFETMRPADLWSVHNFRVWGIELLCYGPIFALALLIRWWVLRRRKDKAPPV